MVALDEPEEHLVLIEDARDRHRRMHRTRKQSLHGFPLHDAFRIRNRIAVRIGFGSPEHFVHAVDQAVRYRVLELLRFLVHFVPAVAHHLHEKQLDHAMAADDERRELFARLRQRDAGIWLIADEPGLRQRS